MLSSITNKFTLFCHCGPVTRFNNIRECTALLKPKLHFSSASSLLNKKDQKPSHWLSYNDVIYPPQEPGEEIRPAVCLF